MDLIFAFIFNGIKSIIQLLDFNLPGISLTYLDFILLSMLIPLIFAFIRGMLNSSGSNLLYSSLNSNVKGLTHLSTKIDKHNSNGWTKNTSVVHTTSGDHSNFYTTTTYNKKGD